MATRKKTAKKKPPKKGVTRKKTTSDKKAFSLNPFQHIEFRILARLLIAAIFAGGIYWLANIQVEHTKPKATSNQTNKNNSPNLSGLSYDDFTFYSRLLEFEVKVAEDNPYADKDEREIVYLIQAGAFRTHERAEEHLVELTLMDLEPKIDKKGEWYRVLIGPLSSRSKMSSTRNRLIENGVQAQVMRQIVN